MNNKIDLILNINDFFDFQLKKNLVNIEKSSQRDMLFEIKSILLFIFGTLLLDKKFLRLMSLNFFFSKYCKVFFARDILF